MASFGMSLLAGFLVAALCVQMGYARDDINNCPTAENCIRYDESGCNSEGERLVCISWQDQSGCQLTPGQDDVEDMCMENDVGRPAAVECSSATIPTVTQATFTPPGTPTVPVGGRITYDCNLGFVLQTNTDATQQFITCTRDGSFSTPVSNCVPMTPVSCADYFSRNNRLATLPVACQDVDIAPPTLLGGTTASVQCCKESSTQISTQIPVATNANSPSQAGPCTVLTDPSGTFPNLVTSNTDLSTLFCGTMTPTVTYTTLTTDIPDVVATTTGCEQKVTISCMAAADSLALALTLNSNIERIYGANIFPPAEQDDITPVSALGHNCDCAAGGAIGPTDPCNGGCMCTKDGTVGEARVDMITTAVTPLNPAFVTAYRTTAFNPADDPVAGEFNIAVAPIICRQTV